MGRINLPPPLPALRGGDQETQSDSPCSLIWADNLRNINLTLTIFTGSLQSPGYQDNPLSQQLCQLQILFIVGKQRIERYGEGGRAEEDEGEEMISVL